MSKAKLEILYCMILIILFSILLSAQDSGGPEERTVSETGAKSGEVPTPPITSHVNLVVVPVTVTDSYGKTVTVLKEDNFEVIDNKVPQEIKSFASEDAPASVVLVFDNSGSMSGKIGRAKEAVAEFMKNSNPQDEFELIAFRNGRPMVVAPLTSKPEDITDRIISDAGGGKTPLVDAIYLALAEVKHKMTQPRKALLIISDGGDNNSRYAWGELGKAVREADAQIYAIGVFEYSVFRSRTPEGDAWSFRFSAKTPEEAAGPFRLEELTGMSGGTMISAGNEKELPDIACRISQRIRDQYVIAYKPSNLLADGMWRKIKVKLKNLPKDLSFLSVSHKKGYYAPH